jgi:SAM-dependent methyltransferase
MSASPKGAVAERLANYLQTVAAERVHKNAFQLLDSGGFEDRFNYFMQYVPDDARRSILVSGSAVGTELLVARAYGFDYACGTEVVHSLAAIAPARLSGLSGCDTVLYDGFRLPFGDSTFDVVSSGHIIEHTADPQSYLYEHLRVLRPGGVLFLEFPDRFHPTELHTTAPGFEWMPGMIRDLTHSYLNSLCRFVTPEHASAYALISSTLNPIGTRDILALIGSSPYSANLRHTYKPLPGFVRNVITREPNLAVTNHSPLRSLPSLFERIEEQPFWPKTAERGNQTALMFKPDAIYAAGGRLARDLAFVLWCIGRFFALKNHISEDLEEQVESVFRGFRIHWTQNPTTTEDQFIPSLFSALLHNIPELDGPYWQPIIVAAFQTQYIQDALTRYYLSWSRDTGHEFEATASFSDWISQCSLTARVKWLRAMVSGFRT